MATCLAAAAACVLMVVVGYVAAGRDNGMFVPLGGAGTVLWLAHWLFTPVWLIAALFAIRRRRWVPALLGGAAIAPTLLPGALLPAACAEGNCL